MVLLIVYSFLKTCLVVVGLYVYFILNTKTRQGLYYDNQTAETYIGLVVSVCEYRSKGLRFGSRIVPKLLVGFSYEIGI